MIKINRVAFGNLEEAYIEKKLSDGVNIIYSDDNNKGKTLLIQGIMYALGNNPIFPSGFNFNNYFFYTDIEINNCIFEFLRKKNIYIIKYNDILQICNSESEFKHYINRHIYKLPIIFKKGVEKIADLELFYQLFFVGQDKRNTSNIINNGYYNKQDFIDMLCSLNGYPIKNIDDYELNRNNEEISKLKEEINTIKKMMKFTKENPNLADFVNRSSDREFIDKKKVVLNEINKNISDYKRKRNREIIRLNKLKNLMLELNSLNRNISQGKIVCAECGSDKVVYSNEDFSFEISNKVVRAQIINSIKESISIKDEVIEEFTRKINEYQENLNNELKEIPIELRKILLYSDEILSYEDSDKKIIDLINKIDMIKTKIDKNNSKSTLSKEKRKLMISEIVELMNKNYSYVDPNGKIVFDDLFTKKDETYSGSEEQEFYYCKLLSLNEYFEHDFPIIIDSFRDGELSSKKESIMIENFKNLNKQVILTSTLKSEEYDTLKYNDIVDINAIDYSINEDSKILQPGYVGEFREILKGFNIS